MPQDSKCASLAAKSIDINAIIIFHPEFFKGETNDKPAFMMFF